MRIAVVAQVEAHDVKPAIKELLRERQNIESIGIAFPPMHEDGDAAKHAKHFRDAVIPAMVALRTSADTLEGIVPHELWPLATYREMLFIK